MTFPLPIFVGLAYLGWLIYDVLQIIKLQNDQLTP